MAPIHVACNWGNVPSVKVLLYLYPNCVYERQEADGKTPLICAAANGREPVVELLLSQPTTAPSFLLHERTSNQWTAVHYAAAKGHLKVIETLHMKGAVMDGKARFVGSPICVASKYGHDHVVKYLVLKAGVTTNPDTQMSPLSWACLQNYASIAKFLLQHKAEVTPEALHLGADRARLLRLLLRNNPGRNLLCSVRNGRTVFDYGWLDDLLDAKNFQQICKSRHYWKPWNLLALIFHRYYFQEGDKDVPALFQLSDEVRPRKVKELKITTMGEVNENEASNDQEAPGDDRETGDDEAVTIEANKSEESEPEFEMATPDNFSWMLHAAVSMPACPEPIIFFLAALFADRVTVMHRGRTPLHIACRSSFVSDSVILSLVDANPSAVSIGEETPVGRLPVALALLQRRTRVISRLLKEYPRGLIDLDSQGFNTMSIAALFADLDALYFCLRSCPDAMKEFQRR